LLKLATSRLGNLGNKLLTYATWRRLEYFRMNGIIPLGLPPVLPTKAPQQLVKLLRAIEGSDGLPGRVGEAARARSWVTRADFYAS